MNFELLLAKRGVNLFTKYYIIEAFIEGIAITSDFKNSFLFKLDF
jgi:hypothetical protein